MKSQQDAVRCTCCPIVGKLIVSAILFLGPVLVLFAVKVGFSWEKFEAEVELADKIQDCNLMLAEVREMEREQDQLLNEERTFSTFDLAAAIECLEARRAALIARETETKTVQESISDRGAKWFIQIYNKWSER